MSVSNNKTTYLISSQVPQFVREDHETFVIFLEEYYKYMASEGQTEYVSKNFNAYLDIDIIKEHLELEHANPLDYNDYYAFLQKMYDNFIKLIPAKVLADRGLILKHAKDFYRATGSEKSVRFLLRILLGKEVNEDFGFYYPKRDILRASDGKWVLEKSIRIGNVQVNNTSNNIAYTNFVNKTIRGASTNATAIVESADIYYESASLITELKLSGTVRSFADGEEVFCYYTEEGQDKFLSATLFSGIVSFVSLQTGGSGYIEGASVPVEGGGGSGAQVVVESTTKGSLDSIGVLFGGAGFRANDTLLITGGAGTGANAVVLSVDISGNVHPNSYNVVASIISLEANTAIGNAKYSNLVSSITDPANAWISNSMSFWAYSNTGPIESCLIITGGNNYTILPTITAQANTLIRTLGILGRLQINDGGLNYSVGDKLEFINRIGTYGVGASANVTSVAANGKILQVRFEEQIGQTVGGMGYEASSLPIVNVSSATGNGANIIVKSLLGYDDSIYGISSKVGQIVTLRLISGGSGYTSAPTINLANMSAGSGALATASIVSGAYTYPGRYINDDGHISSYNFLEDKDYYQNYSYVVRIESSLKDYRKALLDLTHPAGTRLFGQYLITGEGVSITDGLGVSSSNSKFLISQYQIHTSDVLKNGVYNVNTITASYEPDIRQGTYSLKSNVSATYQSGNQQIVINYPSHSLKTGDNVYLQFSNASANITNGFYTVATENANSVIFSVKNANTSFVVLPPNTSNLVANTGYGATNNYITLSEWTTNSNVVIKIGDSVNIGGNLVTVVYTDLTSNNIIVFPGLPGNIVSNTVTVQTAPYNAYGNVKIYDPTISLSVFTPFITNDNAYINFITSDTTLANDRYQVLSSNSTTIKVRHKDIVNASSFSGNVNVHTKTIIVTNIDHGLSNGSNIFFSSYTGDTANATNNLYTITEAKQNTFNIVAANSITNAGLAIIKTSNVIVNVASHGFSSNDYVYLWYTSGDTANLDNGFHEVLVIDNNRFYIIHEHGTVPSSNGNVTVYRNYMNVTVNRTSHGVSLGQNVASMFETGDIANVSNGVFIVNNVANTNSFNIQHNGITISGNISNLISVVSGNVYISVV